MRRPSSHDALRKPMVAAAEGLLCPMGCGRVMTDSVPPGHPSKATLDHVVPHSRGGPSIPDNYVVICSACNSRKGAKLDWIPTGDRALPGADDW